MELFPMATIIDKTVDIYKKLIYIYFKNKFMHIK